MAITTYLQATSSASISWTASANWSGLAAPAAGDSVYLQNSAAAVNSGLLNTATLASLNIPMTFTGSIGLAAQSVISVTGITRSSSTATGTTSAAHGYSAGDVVLIAGANETDYNGSFTLLTASGTTFTYTVANTPTTPATGTISARKRSSLIQPATAVLIGAPSNNSAVGANGAGRICLDTGTAQATVTIANTSSSSTDSGLEPVRLLGSHASNTIYMLGGLVGLATTLPSETATFATINQTGGTLNGGPGLTWSSVYQSGGTLTLASGAASGTLTQTGSGSSATLTGTGSVGTMNVGGRVTLNMRAASGTTVATLNLTDGAVLDLTGNPANISVGTITTSGSVTIKCNAANPGHLSWATLTRGAGSEVSFE